MSGSGMPVSKQNPIFCPGTLFPFAASHQTILQVIECTYNVGMVNSSWRQ